MAVNDFARCEATAILAALDSDCRRLLEIGTGSGRIMRPLVEHGLAVDAVDKDRRVLSRAARAIGRSRRVRFHTKVPASPRTWPAILFSHSL